MPASTSASGRTGVAPFNTIGTRLAMMPTLTTAMPASRMLRNVKARAITRDPSAIQPGAGRSRCSTATLLMTAITTSDSEAKRTPESAAT